MSGLFVPGTFVSYSGKTLHWKVECDVLDDRDWDALALMSVYTLGLFSHIESVPSGGNRFARALVPYITTSGGLLIVDDVLTTGRSMELKRNGRQAKGIVAFARGPLPVWIEAVWKLGV